jgi:regulator of protease activity HflC (stomatin/prohibitin superfamily)
MSVFGIVALVVLGLIVLVLLAALRRMVNIVQQGEVGVVKRLGEYRRTHEPGLVIIAPFVDTLRRVDIREIPRPGDRQDVITKDNVVVSVNATIFTQIVDARQALFSIADFDIAIDALARTALRSVIGTLSLDQALSERERINTDVQQQMEAVTDKWGIRINRIEIVEIAPPPQILQALALEKQADQEKRARILQSEGQQRYAINVAEGNAQAAVRSAGAEQEAAILRAEGNRQAAVLEASGRAQAIETVYGAIREAQPDPTLVAILQLEALGRFADSDNAKIVVPFESVALMGAAQTLRSVLEHAPVRAPSEPAAPPPGAAPPPAAAPPPPAPAAAAAAAAPGNGAPVVMPTVASRA